MVGRFSFEISRGGMYNADMQNLKPLITIVVLVVLAGVVGVLWRKGPAPSPGTVTDATTGTTTGTTAVSTPSLDLTSGSSADATVKNIPLPTAPALSRQVKYSPDLSAEVKQILTQKIATLNASLSSNSNDPGSWMNLAIQYKTAGDYEAAKDVWVYMSNLYPRDSIPRHNLGDLHYNFLKDYPKAEIYFKSAIDAEPTKAINYLSLHELYRDAYKQDTTLAADILKTGISRVIGNQVIDLYSALGSYYQGKNDTANAIIYYTKAREGAQAAGNTDLVAQLNATLAELQK